MLLLPALMPWGFARVPRLAPGPWWNLEDGHVRDVGRDPTGWAWGLLSWQLGIVIGVAVVRLALRSSEVISGSIARFTYFFPWLPRYLPPCSSLVVEVMRR